MCLTELEKQALQLLIDRADDIDEDNGMITYFCSYGVTEKEVPGFRGVCSSLVKKNIICLNGKAYCNMIDIPVDENYQILFDEIN